MRHDTPTPKGCARFLTPAERRAVEELKAGGSVKEVARRLGISHNTLKERLKVIYAKSGVHSARELLIKLYTAPQSPSNNEPILNSLESILDAPDAAAALHALAAAVAVQLDVRAEVLAENVPRRGGGGFLATALAQGQARSDSGVADLPGWPPPLAALRLAWPAGRALLVWSDPRQGIPLAGWRRALLLARFTEAALAQSRVTVAGA